MEGIEPRNGFGETDLPEAVSQSPSPKAAKPDPIQETPPSAAEPTESVLSASMTSGDERSAGGKGHREPNCRAGRNSQCTEQASGPPNPSGRGKAHRRPCWEPLRLDQLLGTTWSVRRYTGSPEGRLVLGLAVVIFLVSLAVLVRWFRGGDSASRPAAQEILPAAHGSSENPWMASLSTPSREGDSGAAQVDGQDETAAQKAGASAGGERTLESFAGFPAKPPEAPPDPGNLRALPGAPRSIGLEQSSHQASISNFAPSASQVLQSKAPAPNGQQEVGPVMSMGSWPTPQRGVASETSGCEQATGVAGLAPAGGRFSEELPFSLSTDVNQVASLSSQAAGTEVAKDSQPVSNLPDPALSQLGPTSSGNASSGQVPAPPGNGPLELVLSQLKENSALGTPGEVHWLSYTTQPGDTVFSLAKRFLGSPGYWPLLVGANPAVFPDPASLEALAPGQQIRIPPRIISNKGPLTNLSRQ
ncbi:MAG: LysM peptidoglycan-binding domain-containing protein [Thermoguttaceae bacterium]|nr:LysM peptidoglycan-binding domain-containing protein [Thermoguttaceae bacterium]MDW8079785.1 LysM peptidoglycan-binding domain-containing protein [Thermoguttaceae bacterium]